MAVNLENASLVLNTKDATTTSDQLTTSTWDNINMKTLLGSMWDKYDSFNLCLSLITSNAVGTDTITTLNDRNVIVSLIGLPFSNQTYSAKSKGLTNQTVLSVFQFPSSTATAINVFQYSSLSVATFYKPNEVISLTIQLRRIDGNIPASTGTYPDQFYVFDIYGVEPKTKLIDHRIKNL
jgi:hypothetical protein